MSAPKVVQSGEGGVMVVVEGVDEKGDVHKRAVFSTRRQPHTTSLSASGTIVYSWQTADDKPGFISTRHTQLCVSQSSSPSSPSSPSSSSSPSSPSSSSSPSSPSSSPTNPTQTRSRCALDSEGYVPVAGVPVASVPGHGDSGYGGHIVLCWASLLVECANHKSLREVWRTVSEKPLHGGGRVLLGEVNPDLMASPRFFVSSLALSEAFQSADLPLLPAICVGIVELPVVVTQTLLRLRHRRPTYKVPHSSLDQLLLLYTRVPPHSGLDHSVGMPRMIQPCRAMNPDSRAMNPDSSVEESKHDTNPFFASETPLRLGSRLWVVSSPFGVVAHRSLAHSLSRGIVSMLDPVTGIFLTDSRTYTGSEGGAVYLDGGQLVGIVCRNTWGVSEASPPFCAVLPVSRLVPKIMEALGTKNYRRSVSNEACSYGGVQSIYREGYSHDRRGTMRTMVTGRANLYVSPTLPPQTFLERASASVVEVRCHTKWGSGVVVHHGTSHYVVTCAHVLGFKAGLPRVLVKYANGVDFAYGTIVYLGNEWFDVAILELENISSLPAAAFRPARIRDYDVQVSEEVHNIGYGHYSTAQGFSQVVGRGVVSRIGRSHLDHRPILLQVSAIVVKGHSGGALVDKDGNVVGIASSHCLTADAKSLYHIGYAIPIPEVTRLLEARECPKKWDAAKSREFLKARQLELEACASDFYATDGVDDIAAKKSLEYEHSVVARSKL